VHGRNALSWERRLALDVWYVDHWSIALDLKILVITVVKVLRREGIRPEGQPTMPRFDECPGRASVSDGTSSGTSCAAPALQAPEYPMRCTGSCAGGAG
jgi:Bacterial sugar transferase